jgi:hypothetical protein
MTEVNFLTHYAFFFFLPWKHWKIYADLSIWWAEYMTAYACFLWVSVISATLVSVQPAHMDYYKLLSVFASTYVLSNETLTLFGSRARRWHVSLWRATWIQSVFFCPLLRDGRIAFVWATSDECQKMGRAALIKIKKICVMQRWISGPSS